MVECSRVVLIDDQTSYCDGFSLAMSITDDLELVGRAPDAPSGIDVSLVLEPDLVVCDYRLPDGQSGTGVATALRSQGLNAPVLILTGYLAPQVERECRAIDRVESISKDRSITDIVTAMRSLVRGGPMPSASSEDETGLRLPDLSEGELEVLEHLNQGLTPAEIAQELHLSLHTIRARTKQLYRKLGVTSQGEAIAHATRLGMLVPPL